MLTRLQSITLTLVLCLTLVCAAEVFAVTADQYLSIRNSHKSAITKISEAKVYPANFVNRVIELSGGVNGIARSEDTASFILNSDGESLIVRSPGNLPDCVANGSKVRALVKIGQGCTASLSDLQLIAATYDYEITERERKQAEAAAAAEKKPEPKKAVSAVQPTNLASRGGVNPAERVQELYGPYRAAIKKFNPRLSDKQLDAITKSILGFSWKYQIDPRLVVSLFLAESHFNPQATSPKGAMGLGQLMPGTARGLGVSNAYDPVQNVEASIRLMRGHLDKYGDLSLALSAYNAGPGAVKKYGGVPPYRETRNYIRKVSEYYRALCGK